MAKKKKADLTTKSSRRGLATGQKYRARIAKGRLLIYTRRTAGLPGAWTVKLRAPERGTSSGYVFSRLGTADDEGATGPDVLTYDEAWAKARAWAPPETEAEPRRPFTVADAVADYLEWYRKHRRSYTQVRQLFEARVLPELGGLPVESLTADRLRKWHEAIADAPALLRGRRDDPERKVRASDTEDQLRARKASANKALTALKAALNRAFAEGRVESDAAWSGKRGVKPFDQKKIAPPPPRWLTTEEVARLLEACESESFRDFVHGALLTGCRRGELAGLRVKDYNPAVGMVAVPAAIAKTGKARGVPLTDEGRELFDRLTAGRPRTAPIFTKPDGEPWGGHDHHRPMRAAYAAAGIEEANFYSLRHTFIAHLKMAGVSAYVIADAAGNSPAMIEQVYGKLLGGFVAEQVRANLPRFTSEGGTSKGATVTPMSGRRRKAR